MQWDEDMLCDFIETLNQLVDAGAILSSDTVEQAMVKLEKGDFENGSTV